MARRGDYRSKRNSRRGGLGLVYGFICLVAIGFAVFFTLSIFFKVGAVEVTGTSIVSAETIRKAAGILPGDNMFLINKMTVTRNIVMEISYVESVRIRRKLPSTVIIEVAESRPIGAVAGTNEYWLFTSGGKLLTAVPEVRLPSGIPVVSGITVLMPQEGAEMSLSLEDSDKQAPMLVILSALDESGLLEDTVSLDMSKVFDVRFNYNGRYTVILGMPTEVEYKLRFLKEVMATRSTNERAAIDITQAQEKTARVIVEG